MSKLFYGSGKGIAINGEQNEAAGQFPCECCSTGSGKEQIIVTGTDTALLHTRKMRHFPAPA
ncbi:MAG: hypothetical protein LBT46_05655 [Planctomycetaceae bacterium]|nr:hypothetical protein [Planctomycetaceae bacterium]